MALTDIKMSRLSQIDSDWNSRFRSYPAPYLARTLYEYGSPFHWHWLGAFIGDVRLTRLTAASYFSVSDLPSNDWRRRNLHTPSIILLNKLRFRTPDVWLITIFAHPSDVEISPRHTCECKLDYALWCHPLTPSISYSAKYVAVLPQQLAI